MRRAADRTDRVVNRYVKENLPEADQRRAQEQSEETAVQHRQENASSHAHRAEQNRIADREYQGKNRGQGGKNADLERIGAELQRAQRNRDLAAAMGAAGEHREQHDEID
jgi:hypothetical protein